MLLFYYSKKVFDAWITSSMVNDVIELIFLSIYGILQITELKFRFDVERNCKTFMMVKSRSTRFNDVMQSSIMETMYFKNTAIREKTIVAAAMEKVHSLDSQFYLLSSVSFNLCT